MIPGFSASGVLPPFVGDPAANNQRSPYPASIREVVVRFASSMRRCEILRGWLNHRSALHARGFVAGFQWVNGGFCEQLAAREPNDVDLVTFLVPPPAADLKSVAARHPELFDPRQTKRHFLCDVYFLRLSPDGYTDPRRVSYFYSRRSGLMPRWTA